MVLGAALLCIALLLASAFFVMAEFAAVRVRATQLEALTDSDSRAVQALEVHRGLGHHLSAVQVGIVLCAISLGAVGEDLFARLFQQLFDRIPWPGLRDRKSVV